jgi:hypothetical protein
VPPPFRPQAFDFNHISAVERAGLNGLNEGQQISFELVTDRRSGKTSAGNLRTACKDVGERSQN